MPLLARSQVNHDTQLLTFGLPEDFDSLGLSTCACILAQSENDSGEAVVRPYTPVSTNAQRGSFDLLVKVYEDGSMSKALGSVPVGNASISFKHIDFNVKLQYPFGKKRIGMICGGSGITPMLQALQALVGTPGDSTEEIRLLYGNKSSRDILAKDLLESWASQDDRFSIVHVLEDAREIVDDSNVESGFIDRNLIQRHMFDSPCDDTIVFVCGPPPMYDALCGPREEKDVSGLLGDMGFGNEHVYKF